MTRVEIEIDELVIHGLSRAEAADLQATIEQHLRTLARGADPAAMRTREIDAVRPRPLPTGDRPLGRRVAEQIWSAATASTERGWQS
jgi:hypothetical protein